MDEGMIDQAQQPDPNAEEPELTPEETPTPEEQDAYDQAMSMVSEIIYNNDQAHDAVIKQLSEGEPAEAVAHVTSFIITQLEEALKGQLNEVIIIPLADEISNSLLELALEAGIFELTDKIVMGAKGAVMRVLFEDYGIEEDQMESMLQGVTAGDVETLHSQFGGEE